MRNPAAHEADIAILGSGASGTHGLLRILSQLTDRAASPDDVTRITVVDRDEQFHSGIPYGHRSGRSSLLISDLEAFLPDRERGEFIAWLNQRQEEMLRWADDGRTPGSPLAEAMERDWVLRHRSDIAACRWDRLYLPRRLYGQYLAELVEQALEDAREVAEVDFVHADVTEVTHGDSDGDSDEVVLRERGDDGAIRFELHAHSLLLAIGSPPVRQLVVSGSSSTAGATGSDDLLDAGFVADVHTPEIEHVIDRIRVRLESLPTEKRSILLVGGNADALEFLLASRRLRQRTGARLFILSSFGRPHYWYPDRPGQTASTPILDHLLATAAAGSVLRAEELHAAVRAEIATAIANGTANSVIAALVTAVGSSLAYMDEYELCSMATEYGIAINSLLRRAGGDSLDFLAEGIADGSITCIPGRFRAAEIHDDMLFATVDPPPGTIPTPNENAALPPDDGYAVIVNGTGFERVTSTRAPLLRQLLGSGTVRASASRTGLALDGSFRAAPGIFVLGPLIAGHHHRRSAFWHVESVIRIIQLAGPVADCLVTDTLSRRSTKERLLTT